MRKMKMLFGAVLVLVLMAFSAQAAQAVTVNGGTLTDPWFAQNNGPAAGSHVFSIGGTLVVTCTSMTVNNGTHTATTATFRPAYSGCTANIGGIPFPATVTVNCNWRLTPLTYNAATGASTGSLLVGVSPCANPAVKVDIGANCDVLIPSQTLVHGANGTLAGQNYSSAGASNTAGPNILVTANVTGIAFTTTGCPAGVPVSGNSATYSGRMYSSATTGRGLWIS